jgi:hypothetical protein
MHEIEWWIVEVTYYFRPSLVFGQTVQLISGPDRQIRACNVSCRSMNLNRPTTDAARNVQNRNLKGSIGAPASFHPSLMGFTKRILIP